MSETHTTKQPLDTIELVINRREVLFILSVLEQHKKQHEQLAEHLEALDQYTPEAGVLCLIDLEINPHYIIIAKVKDIILEIKQQLDGQPNV